MAQKRSAENSEGFSSAKILKQLEEEDVDVSMDISILSSDLESSLEYDCMLKAFSVMLQKERKEGNRFICVGENDLGNIIKLLPVIEKLVSRYSIKRSPKLIDVPFETDDAEIGDLITVLSLKENSYKRGHFDIDIRKCVKKEEGSYQYTSEGVRVTVLLTTALKEVLLRYQSLIASAVEKSKEVITMAMAHIVIREINELADPRQNCYGCQLQHASQRDHMNHGGCLSEEQPTWAESCNIYWQAGTSLINDEAVQNLAKKAASRVPQLQGRFIPGLISTETIPESDVKDIVLRKEELVDDPLLKIYTEI